jgi:hypothetical protein
MRIIKIAGLCAVLGGCWTTGQDVATSTGAGNQFVGKNVDVVVARFGKPMGRKKMDNDQMTYVWEFAAADLPANQRSFTGQGGLYEDGQTPGAMSEDLRICKLSVVTSPEGTVTQFSAEDSNGTGAPKMTFGTAGSFCSQRLQL